MFPLTPDVFDPVAWWAAVDGSRTALIEAASGRRHSYSALDASADQWRVRLSRWGVRSGDRVAILAQSRAELIALLFGGVRCGASLVPLNWRVSPVGRSRPTRVSRAAAS